MKYLRRVIMIMLMVVVVGYIAICAGLYFFQRSLIYSPQPRRVDSGATMMTPHGATAKVLVSTRPHDGPAALIYFGGRSEDVSNTLPAYSDAFPDRALYLMHYRSYGGSEGSPTEDALIADGLALFDEVSKTHSDILIVGRSLGTGVAVHVASLKTPSRLVLVTPYDSLQEIAQYSFPWFPVSWLLTDKFESWRYAPQVKCPTLILAAEEDNIVPHANSDLLLSRFPPGIATYRVLQGTGHGTISGSPEYMPLLKGSP